MKEENTKGERWEVMGVKFLSHLTTREPKVGPTATCTPSRNEGKSALFDIPLLNFFTLRRRNPFDNKW